MKTSNTARFDELMKLRDEFNAKLQESFEKYESRIKQYNSEKNKKAHKITKYPTSLELSKENHLYINQKRSKNYHPSRRNSLKKEVIYINCQNVPGVFLKKNLSHGGHNI